MKGGLMIEFVYHLLEKIGFTHPLHPAITHLPMGMVFGAILFLAVSFVFKKDDLARTAHHCITLALIFVLPTMLLGFMDWQYKFDGEWSNIIVTKFVLALTLLIFLIGNFYGPFFSFSQKFEFKILLSRLEIIFDL